MRIQKDGRPLQQNDHFATLHRGIYLHGTN